MTFATNGAPYYEQLVMQIKQQIVQGRLQPGTNYLPFGQWQLKCILIRTQSVRLIRFWSGSEPFIP
ncbi:transcription regulator [Lactiplantibacillus plantarum]|nr:transcription regulator [Lactiplantibacillus plantarum]